MRPSARVSSGFCPLGRSRTSSCHPWWSPNSKPHPLLPAAAVEELRQRAADGDRSADGRLVDLLAEQGRIDELREETAAGTAGAVAALRRITVIRKELGLPRIRCHFLERPSVLNPSSADQKTRPPHVA
jgi:hypothetical protein